MASDLASVVGLPLPGNEEAADRLAKLLEQPSQFPPGWVAVPLADLRDVLLRLRSKTETLERTRERLFAAQPAEKLMSDETLADHLGVPVSTVRGWRARNVGPPAVKVGKHVRYQPDDVRSSMRNVC